MNMAMLSFYVKWEANKHAYVGITFPFAFDSDEVLPELSDALGGPPPSATAAA